MSYRRSVPAKGGRRDRRERTTVRNKRIFGAVSGIALGAFAVGSFASVGVNAWATDEPSTQAISVPAAEVAPIEAQADGLEVVVETEEESIEHGLVETKNYSALEGTSTVVTEGSEGSALISYTVTLKDGVEIDRAEDRRVVVSEPVDEVVSVGAMSIPKSSNAGANRALGKEMAAAKHGWTGSEWECLNTLWTRESNWRHTAHNSSSGAHGIPQALPGSKMASHGADWATNPATQISWGLSYVKGRYGTPCGAWGHFLQKNWY